ADEIDAIAVGARVGRRLREPGLQDATDSAVDKETTVLPEALRGGGIAAPFFVSDGSADTPTGIDLADVRRAIRETRKVRITYANAEGQQSDRTIWPVAMAYYVDVTLLGAWCELRDDFRHFRVDRIVSSRILDDRFPTDNGRL